MIRYNELSYEQLLEIEDQWLEQEDDADFSWLNEGIRLYKSLIRQNREETRFRETLANIYLMQGEDLKMQQHSYEEATKTFQILVRLDPQNPIAHYRLGFLYFYQKEWPKSIDSFQQAIIKKATTQRKNLTNEQMVKAHHYMLKASQIIINETLKRIEEIPAVDLQLFQEINYLVEEIRSGEDSHIEKPYLMVVDGIEQVYITEREYEELSDPDENSDIVILNHYSIHDTRLMFRGSVVDITSNQVPLLEIIMKHPDGISRENIISRRNTPSRNPDNALRRSISRIRERLETTFPDIEFIQTIDGGYKWTQQYNYRMFKHNRDVGTDLLLD